MNDLERTPGGAILMDGNRLRDETVARIRGELDAMGSPAVCLATVLVGGDRPSHIYVRMKHKKAEEAGLISKGVELPEESTQAEVEAAVAELVADPAVHGILVQLPLPKQIRAEVVISAVAPSILVAEQYLLCEREMARSTRLALRSFPVMRNKR